MDGDDARGPRLSRRTALLAGGGLVAALAAGGGAFAAAKDRFRPLAAPTAPASSPAPSGPAPSPSASTTVAPAPTPAPPTLTGPAQPGVELHPAWTSNLQCFVPVPETGEWFTTQARTGTSRLTDPSALAVGDIVVSRLGADGGLLDSMVLPDGGHGMGLVVRVEAGVRTVYTCWFAPDASGRLYDLVRLPYAAGTAARSTATAVVAGAGFPLDPCYDASTDSVTLRHQGGGGPQYTRHAWADFAAGDLSRPTGGIATPDSPPTHQGFCSLGDGFFFYTGAGSDVPGGDPVLITEYSWTTGRPTGFSTNASGNSRQADGTYLGGRMEPEGAAIVVDGGGTALLVGVTNGGSSKSHRTFRYPLATA